MMSNDSREEPQDDQVVSNERYYFNTYSLVPLQLEKELAKSNIQYLKDCGSSLQPYVVYTFFRKDIETVDSILDQIAKESNEDEKRRKQRKIKQKLLPEAKQKRVAVGMLLIVILIIFLSLIL